MQEAKPEEEDELVRGPAGERADEGGPQAVPHEGPNLAERFGGLRARLFKTERGDERADAAPSSDQGAGTIGKMKERLRSLLDRDKAQAAPGAGLSVPPGDPGVPDGPQMGAGAPKAHQGVASRIADGFKKALGGGIAARRAAEAERVALAALEAYGSEVAADTLAALGPGRLCSFRISENRPVPRAHLL
eukprot:jgi/Botrbrau1/7725/Bobra.0159s0157.1